MLAIGALAAPASAGVKVRFYTPNHDLLHIHGHLIAYDAHPEPGREIARYGATWELRKYASDLDQYGTLVYSVILTPGACVIRDIRAHPRLVRLKLNLDRREAQPRCFREGQRA
jgi:hypothetical protein